jgi:hypothetical protein
MEPSGWISAVMEHPTGQLMQVRVFVMAFLS